MGSIHLTKDKVQWRALVDTMNLLFLWSSYWWFM